MIIKMNSGRLIVFSLTFVSYALYHASRKTLSGVKSSISEDWINGTTHKHLFPSAASAQTFLGSLDALFMICYAFALIFWGWIGDRRNPLQVVVFGMVGSAITLTAFGTLPHWLQFYSIPWYVSTYALFGVVQACGWPNEVAIMANWFPQNNRGFIMGLWAACQPVGNILGAFTISLILPLGYEKTFAFNSLLILVGAAVLLIFVSPKPSESVIERNRQPRRHSSPLRHDSSASSSSSLEDESDENREHIFGSREGTHQPVSICQAIFLPNVLPYCLCNACLKFVNYAFFFWLPYYLTLKYRWPESETNQLAIWYDVGGIVGSVVGGITSDRIRHRSPVLLLMLTISVPLLLAYASLGPNRALHMMAMFFLGVTISGPYNLIVGTIAIDLGSQPALAGNEKAMSTVTGLIDGTGSAGSALGQLFVPIIQNGLGWAWVFYLFILMNVLSAICLLRRFAHDVKVIWHTRHSRSRRRENEPLLSSEN